MFVTKIRRGKARAGTDGFPRMGRGVVEMVANTHRAPMDHRSGHMMIPKGAESLAIQEINDRLEPVA